LVSRILVLEVHAKGKKLPSVVRTARIGTRLPGLERMPTYVCNVCGQPPNVPLDRLEREVPSCETCGSTPRFRGIVHALSLGLFGESLPISLFPQRRDLHGLGLSDWGGYATRLAKKFDHTNTLLHTEPHLDLTEIDGSLAGTLDFLISSEVFEHVAPPVGHAFATTACLLKPGGVFVLTVPYGLGADTVEHFPDLGDHKIVSDETGEGVLETAARDGSVVRYRNLVFHGGNGATLEMRIFALASLEKHLRQLGFHSVEVLGDEPRYGIVWPEAWSRPILDPKRDAPLSETLSAPEWRTPQLHCPEPIAVRTGARSRSSGRRMKRVRL
jgi:hypothetical protein